MMEASQLRPDQVMGLIEITPEQQAAIREVAGLMPHMTELPVERRRKIVEVFKRSLTQQVAVALRVPEPVFS